MMEFSVIAKTFERMEKTKKRLELTDILVELFKNDAVINDRGTYKNIPQEIVSNVVYLLQGIIRPQFEGVELGIAERLAIKAISKSSGLTIKKIEDDYNKCGDLGETASNMLKQKTQTT